MTSTCAFVFVFIASAGFAIASGDDCLCSRSQPPVACDCWPCQCASCPAYPAAVCVTKQCGRCSNDFYVGHIKVNCDCNSAIANCLVDPCAGATCPSNPQATCVANYCGGCNAEFYDDDCERVDCYDDDDDDDDDRK